MCYVQKTKRLKRNTFNLIILILFIANFVASSTYVFATDYTWTERQPAGDAARIWGAVDSDFDGSNLIAGVGSAANGRLYTSSNSGADWTERQPAGVNNRVWGAVASDDDGSHLIAGISSGTNGRLYTSSDSGANWTERQPAGDVNVNWISVDSDSDGSNLIAAVNNARLYTSSDGGANWTERQPAGDVNAGWYAVASDADGSHLVAAVTSGRLYTSSDSGANWTERQPAGASNMGWRAVASDADGSNIVAVNTTKTLYTSSDGGANWTSRVPVSNDTATWTSAASNDDGSKLIISGAFNQGPDSTAYMYSSSDGGANWTWHDLGAEDAPKVVSLSSSGSRAISGDKGNGGRLYTGLLDESPTVSITSPDDADVVRGTIDLTASASDDVSVSGVQFKRDTNTLIGSEDTGSPYSVSFDTTAVTDGEYEIIAVARDSGGNYATSTAVTITIDNTAPTISITTPTEGETLTTWSNPTVSWGDSDTCEYKLNSDAYSSVACTSPVTIPTPAEGAHTLTIRGTDEAGNATTDSTSFTYAIPVEETIVSYGSTAQRRQEILNQNPNNSIHTMIQALTAQVAVLQNLLNTLHPTLNTLFTRDLERGDTGEDVRALQKFLNSKGFTVATTGPGSPGNETSIFGDATEEALIRYQQSLNISPAVGYFGPVTRTIVVQ